MFFSFSRLTLHAFKTIVGKKIAHILGWQETVQNIGMKMGECRVEFSMEHRDDLPLPDTIWHEFLSWYLIYSEK